MYSSPRLITSLQSQLDHLGTKQLIELTEKILSSLHGSLSSGGGGTRPYHLLPKCLGLLRTVERGPFNLANGVVVRDGKGFLDHVVSHLEETPLSADSMVNYAMMLRDLNLPPSCISSLVSDSPPSFCKCSFNSGVAGISFSCIDELVGVSGISLHGFVILLEPAARAIRIPVSSAILHWLLLPSLPGRFHLFPSDISSCVSEEW